MAQHVSKGARYHAVTANRLTDGEVVYFSDQSTWVLAFEDAAIADGPEASEALLAKAKPEGFSQFVVEVYPFEVIEDETSKTFQPASVREIIRAAGPTVRLDLGKQAETG